VRDISESRLRVVHVSKMWCRIAGVGCAGPTGFIYDWLPVHLLNSVQTVGGFFRERGVAKFNLEPLHVEASPNSTVEVSHYTLQSTSGHHESDWYFGL
jgi:hypothetical protein